MNELNKKILDKFPELYCGILEGIEIAEKMVSDKLRDEVNEVDPFINGEYIKAYVVLSLKLQKQFDQLRLDLMNKWVTKND